MSGGARTDGAPGRRAARPLAAALAAGLVLLVPDRVTPSPAVAAETRAASPEVVARVNGRPILRSEFDLAVQMHFQGRRSGVALDELKAVRTTVLEGLIDNELLYQEAVRARSEVRDADVEAEVKRVRGAFPSDGGLDALLRTYGVPEGDFRAQVRRSLVVTRFVDTRLAGDIEITDEEIRRYYDQNPTQMVRPERVRASQILVRIAGESAGARAAGREKIEAILKEIRDGLDFAEAAKRYSDGADAGRGGDLGYLVRDGGMPALERAAFALRPGEISDIVETRAGFHLLKVVERLPEGPVPMTEARDTIRASLRARERDQRVKKHVEKLREKASIERLESAGT